jgi:putative hemolysin
LLRQSLELGRSWIRQEYQQKPLPLYLLWRSIAGLLYQNPQYQYLIGPVSISNSLSKISRSLIVDYVMKHHFDEELGQYVRPRKRFRPDFARFDATLLMGTEAKLMSLDQLISDIEPAHMRLPVMLRQYLALNGRIICFNVDREFSNSLDGFLVLNVRDIPLAFIRKRS